MVGEVYHLSYIALTGSDNIRNIETGGNQPLRANCFPDEL